MSECKKFIEKIYFNNNKRAFTLSELLISLGVIAILSALTFPVIFNLIPDKNVLMAKRAFYTTETVVSSLINDNNCYPRQKGKAGFDDGAKYKNCLGWKYEGTEESNIQKKFLTLFSSQLDVKSQSKDLKTITTKDGMSWVFDNTFKNNNKLSYMYLTVDVNGEDNDPNCGQSVKSTKCPDTRKSGFDKFTMKIYADGKIDIEDCWAVLAAKTDKKITGSEDITSKCEELNQKSD